MKKNQKTKGKLEPGRHGDFSLYFHICSPGGSLVRFWNLKGLVMVESAPSHPRDGARGLLRHKEQH